VANQEQQSDQDQSLAPLMWRFVFKVVWYQEDAKPFNQIYVQNILKWRQHFLPRLE